MDELLATETLKLLNGCSKMHMLGLCTCAMKKDAISYAYYKGKCFFIKQI